MNTKENVLEIARRALADIIKRKKDYEAMAHVDDRTWQYASGAQAGAFEVIHALERHLEEK